MKIDSPVLDKIHKALWKWMRNECRDDCDMYDIIDVMEEQSLVDLNIWDVMDSMVFEKRISFQNVYDIKVNNPSMFSKTTNV